MLNKFGTSLMYFGWRTFTLILLSMLMLACSSDKQGYEVEVSQGRLSISPLKQTKNLTLMTHGQAEIFKHVEYKKQINEPVDIVLLYDRTASMQNVIEETGDAGNRLIESIQELIPDSRFSIATVGDYKVFSPTVADGEVWQLNSGFSQDPIALQQAVKAITILNGGDWPEAYTRGFYEVVKLNWRPEAKKIVIFFGDSTPHMVDPGEDNIINTPDDLNWDSVIESTRQRGIQIMGIYTRTDSAVLNTFQHMTQQTNGKSFPLDDAKQASKIIMKSIRSAFDPEISLQPLRNGKHWVNNIQQKEVLFGDDIVYQVQLKVPEGTDPGVYPIQLQFTPETSAILATQNIHTEQQFTINVVTGWYNSYWIPILPLIALLLLLFYFLYKANRGHSVKSKATYIPSQNYSLMKLLIDLLFITTVLGLLLWVYLVSQQVYLSQLMTRFM